MARVDITAPPFNASPLSGDNTAAIQAAITAAAVDDEIWIPSGEFLTPRTASPWSNLANKRLHWNGLGTLAMTPTDAMDGDPFGNHIATLYFTAAASGSTIRNISFEGHKDGSGGPTEYIGREQYEHHRAMFFEETTDVLVEDVTVRNYTGDAAQLYNSCERFVFRRVVAEWQGRDNITLAPFGPLTPVRDVLIEDCTLRGASNQQIDNEHGCAHGVIVRDCIIERASNLLSIGLAIAGSGTDINDPSTGWEIYDNQILGCIRFTWTSDSIIRDNVITNDRQISAIELERGQSNNQILRNQITQTQNVINNLAGVYLNGTNGGGAAEILIEDNDVQLTRAQSFGIRADGIISMRAINNRLRGAGVSVAGFHGIRIRPTVTTRDTEFVVLHRNDVRDFGAAGIGIAGNLIAGKRAQIRYLEAIQNNLYNSAPGGSMSVGVQLLDAAGTLFDGRVAGNVSGVGITTAVIPAASPYVAYSFAAVPSDVAADVSDLGPGASLADGSVAADLEDGGWTAEAA